jgi:hypothetical protein
MHRLPGHGWGTTSARRCKPSSCRNYRGFYTEALRLCQGEGKHPPCAPVGFSFSPPARHARERLDVHFINTRPGYTASACGLASFPRKWESRRRAPWGLDARLRGHDVLLAPDLRNGHLGIFQPVARPGTPGQAGSAGGRRLDASSCATMMRGKMWTRRTDRWDIHSR